MDIELHRLLNRAKPCPSYSNQAQAYKLEFLKVKAVQENVECTLVFVHNTWVLSSLLRYILAFKTESESYPVNGRDSLLLAYHRTPTWQSLCQQARASGLRSH